MKRAKFNIKDLDIIKFVQNCQCPIQFVVSEEDTYIKSKHTLKLYNAYNNKKYSKSIRYVNGDHNAQ